MHTGMDTIAPRDSYVELIDPAARTHGRPGSGGNTDLSAQALDALRSSRQAVCITDAQVDLPGPTITFVNDAYTDIFCCEFDDAIGRTPRIGQGPLTNRRVLDRLRRHLEAGESIQAQAINYRLDGSAFRLRWSIDPLFGAEQARRPVGFVAYMRDITVEDRLRRRLTAIDALLERGRAITAAPSVERSPLVADALAAALRPVLSEIGVAEVRVGDAIETTQVELEAIGSSTPVREEFGWSDGTVVVDIHPDADELFDRAAISELIEHVRWLDAVGEPH